jgi:hypothetical protein|tara:strand:- start:14445 stop:14666 length:222 start_codon:yes stop_codon:yes gene_type:complete
MKFRQFLLINGVLFVIPFLLVVYSLINSEFQIIYEGEVMNSLLFKAKLLIVVIFMWLSFSSGSYLVYEMKKRN